MRVLPLLLATLGLAAPLRKPIYQKGSDVVIKRAAGRAWICVRDEVQKLIVECPLGAYELAESSSHLSASVSQALMENVELENVRCIELLLDLNQTSPNMRTSATDYEEYPLMYAAYRGLSGAAGALLRHYADTEVRNSGDASRDWTPVLWAARGGRSHTLQLLVEHGAVLCRRPLDIYTIMMDETTLATVEALLPTSATEPGFYLARLERCDGLRECEPGFYCPGKYTLTNERIACPANTYNTRPRRDTPVACVPCGRERPLAPPGSTSKDACYGTARPLELPKRRAAPKKMLRKAAAPLASDIRAWAKSCAKSP